jgi:hypothetical protein
MAPAPPARGGGESGEGEGEGDEPTEADAGRVTKAWCKLLGAKSPCGCSGGGGDSKCCCCWWVRGGGGEGESMLPGASGEGDARALLGPERILRGRGGLTF